MVKRIPVAVSLPLCFVGKGNLTDSPDGWNVLTFSTDLLGIVKLELTRVWEITDGSNSRKEHQLGLVMALYRMTLRFWQREELLKRFGPLVHLGGPKDHESTSAAHWAGCPVQGILPNHCDM